ncbi:MAG: hypothetical protein KDB23_05090 [Planctomycetales bacterium]|nr:hypothetical protein [Planctomycetales bacterium]
MNDLVEQKPWQTIASAVVLTALAAGMGWGIRGQYGHETGAMIAGTLASLTLVLIYVPTAPSLFAARAAAMMTVAIGIGGSMTYGQTIGLTQDSNLIGNRHALGWGMLGLFIKGALWIGFGGAFLGMGLSGTRYRMREVVALLLGLVALMYLGIWILNSPYDPLHKSLPRYYFSADWFWNPHGGDIKPRREVWGGYMCALTGLFLYVRFARRDRLAARLTLFGLIGGGLGFAGGQCLQAFHAWHPEALSDGWIGSYTQYVNWWNMMETTFGAVWGATMALGVGLNRHLIAVPADVEEVQFSAIEEVALCALHVVLLITSSFLDFDDAPAWFDFYLEYGLVMAMLPLIGIIGGRYWPYLLLLPIAAIPNCGKTLVMLSYNTDRIRPAVGWLTLVELPIAVATTLAAWLIVQSLQQQSARKFAAIALLATTVLYFGANTMVFDYAWPWREWTGRTPNQLLFSIAAISLTILAAANLRSPVRRHA